MKKNELDLVDYEEFKKTYYKSFQTIDSLIDNTEGYKISKLTDDIRFFIQRMYILVDKFEKEINAFKISRDENIMDELSELLFLFVSYSSAIMTIYGDKLNKKFPIDKEEKNFKRIFKDGTNNLVIGVLRNSFHHGDFCRIKWLYVKKQNLDTRFYITIENDILEELVDNRNDKMTFRLDTKGKKYIDISDGKLDILKLIKDYINQVEEFYDWHKNKRAKIYIDDMNIYNILIKNLKKLSNEKNWTIRNVYLCLEDRLESKF